jgi:ubiquinone/menaquinone biosynthesis C-methylase UbiE
MTLLHHIGATYDSIVSEYYDSFRHPTCANFNELSRKFLIPRIEALAESARSVLEVGTGRSVVAPTLADYCSRLDHVILLDSSEAMLKHSQEWETRGAHLSMADARRTYLRSNSVDLLVASLGDPYNVSDFWFEAARVLRTTGTCLFTMPTPEWADWFRPIHQRSEAEFVLADGSVILVPSYVPSLIDQTRMMEVAGFSVRDILPYFVRDISGPVSSKLLPPTGGSDQLPILRGFVAVRVE